MTVYQPSYCCTFGTLPLRMMRGICARSRARAGGNERYS